MASEAAETDYDEAFCKRGSHSKVSRRHLALICDIGLTWPGLRQSIKEILPAVFAGTTIKVNAIT